MTSGTADPRNRTSAPAPGATGERRLSPLFRTPGTASHAIIVVLPNEHPPLVRYAIAVAAPILALGTSFLLAPYLQHVIFLFFWPAVIAAAWLGGIGPGLLASVLSVLAADYFLIEPTGAISLTRPDDVIPFAMFLVATTAIAALTNAARAARRSAAEAAGRNAELAQELELQAAELEQQLEESHALSEELEQTAEELSERTIAAEAAEAFSRGIVDSITHPFVVHDAEWRFRYINEAAAAVFRQSPRASHEPPVGRVLWDVYPDIAGTVFEREMRRAATERRPVTFEAYYPGRGEWSLLSCFPLPDGGLATQWVDITPKKRIEEAEHFLNQVSEVLASSLDYEVTLEQLAQVLVPRLADWCVVHIVDGDGTPHQLAVAHVDPAKAHWAKALNERYPPRADAPTGVPNVLRTGKPELYPEITDELLVAGARDEEHLRILREVGMQSAVVVPLLAGGTAVGAVTLVGAESGRRYSDRDLPLITEIARRAALAVENARLHREALAAKAIAEEANRAKTQFLATMSHELRTPLNAISGYAELLSLGLRGPTTPEQQEDLGRIMRSQRHLLGVINDILNFARLEAGHIEYHIANVPLAEMVDDLESLIRPQLAAKQIALSCEPVDRDLVARADAEKVRQVLLNLLANAVKFTAPRGEVSVSCSHDDAHVHIHVRDTGVGVPADRRAVIFEPFVQLHRTLAQPAEGTGLGLAISRDLARGMGGNLSVESEPGVGSTFTLTLERGR